MESDFYQQQQEKMANQAPEQPPTNPEVQTTPPLAQMPPVWKSKKFFFILLAFFGLAIVSGCTFFLYQNAKNSMVGPLPKLKDTPSSSITVQPSPSPTSDPETATWNLYAKPGLYFSFRYPKDYQIVSEEPRKVVLGFAPTPTDKVIPYLTVTMDGSSSYKDLPTCTKDMTSPCISKKQTITLDSKQAASVDLRGGVDDAYSIVTLSGTPGIELKMNVAGGGLSETFRKILSTVREGSAFEYPKTPFKKSYSDVVLPLSLQYEFPTYDVNTVISDSTALKADREIWVSIPNTDSILLEINYYKSSLTAIDWWNSVGKAKFDAAQQEYINAVNPKPTGITSPTFVTTPITFAGQSGIKAMGHVELAQAPGDEELTIVHYKDGIYLIRPMAEKKDKLILEETLNSITFR